MSIEDKLKEERNFIKFSPKTIDEINVKSIENANNNKQLGLLEIEMEQFNEEISLIYNIQGLKSLKKYLLEPLKKETAYSLLKSINSSLSMQSYILDKGVVSTETNYVFIKEINKIPYVYFMYIPLATDFIQDVGEIKKLVFSIVISLEDDDLRNKMLEFSVQKLDIENLLKILKDNSVDSINIEHVDDHELTDSFPCKSLEETPEDLSKTIEVQEDDENDETTIIDFEETTLIDEKELDLTEVKAKLLINNEGVFVENPLIEDINNIGRSRFSDIIIQNKVVSKRHAIIFRDGKNFYIKDAGSKNGTFVNERKLKDNEKHKLRNKDKLKFGNVRAEFQM